MGNFMQKLYRWWIGIFIALFAAWQLWTIQQPDLSAPPQRQWFQQVTKEYLSTLKQTLLRHLARGPIEAVKVCSDTAQLLNQHFSQRYGIHIRRVSLRPRNPADTADTFERQWLQRFEQMKEQGVALDTVAVLEAISQGTDTVYRFLKPIVINTAVCLQCHGPEDHLDPQLLAFLKQRYPGDQARNHQLGDIRGAVSIVWKTAR